MRFHTIKITNFRCFEDLELEFHPRLNVFIGVNGSGKTALLDAIKISLGAIFTGMDSEWVPNVKIKKDDILYSKFSKNLEPKPPASIATSGVFNGEILHWKRSLHHTGPHAKTDNKGAINVKKISNLLANKIKNNDDGAVLPLLAYFTTDRLCGCKTLTFDGTLGSRFRGYNLCMEATYSFEDGNWFKTQELARLQAVRHKEDHKLPELDLVQKIMARFVPGVVDVYFDFERECVCLKFEDNTYQPIHALSDGFKNLLVLISDLVVRALLLNPELGIKANEVPGVVLVDEVDLQLHPAWQRRVIPALLDVFPNVQFFFTTHSPMTLASLEPYIDDPEPNIFILKNSSIEPLSQEIFGTANHWLTKVFGLEEPRSLEAEHALKKAKDLLADKNPDPILIKRTSQDLMRLVQAHDLFWIRWNHFAEQNGVALSISSPKAMFKVSKKVSSGLIFNVYRADSKNMLEYGIS